MARAFLRYALATDNPLSNSKYVLQNLQGGGESRAALQAHLNRSHTYAELAAVLDMTPEWEAAVERLRLALERDPEAWGSRTPTHIFDHDFGDGAMKKKRKGKPQGNVHTEPQHFR